MWYEAYIAERAKHEATQRVAVESLQLAKDALLAANDEIRELEQDNETLATACEESLALVFEGIDEIESLELPDVVVTAIRQIAEHGYYYANSYDQGSFAAAATAHQG